MKSKQTAALLAIFLGAFGIHKFYLGQNKQGVLFLLFGIFLFPIAFIVSFVQGIIWLSQSDEKFYSTHGITNKNATQSIIESSASFVNLNLNKVKKSSQKAIGKAYLTGCSWILLSELDNIEYIFRDNNQLLISKNGNVKKNEYELIVDNDSILISNNSTSELYNIVLVQNDFLFLNKKSENKILKFVNQTKFKDELKADFIKLANELEY